MGASYVTDASHLCGGVARQLDNKIHEQVPWVPTVAKLVGHWEQMVESQLLPPEGPGRESQLLPNPGGLSTRPSCCICG
jgi:hypothetical protein